MIDPALLAAMLTNEQLERKVSITEKDDRNVFRRFRPRKPCPTC
jgi:hypothetical protein